MSSQNLQRPKPNQPSSSSHQSSGKSSGESSGSAAPPHSDRSKSLSSNQTEAIKDTIVKKIQGLSGGLHTYPIREMVQHAQDFGPYLKKQRLETNQIRKFLDAVNRLKADLTQAKDFSAIETEVVLLKPKLAYAAARQSPAKPLSDVISVAIDKVHNREDFDRFVQLIESIIAYHKEEGGK